MITHHHEQYLSAVANGLGCSLIPGECMSFKLARHVVRGTP